MSESTESVFTFNLGDSVELAMSGETGIVIGRAEYLEEAPAYLIRYKSADGRLVQSWWSKEVLVRPGK